MTKILSDNAQGKNGAIANFVFAHGAGAGMQHPFMQEVAQGLAQQQVNVLRFNFAYMQLAEEQGKRRPPEKMEKLQQQFHTVLQQLDSSLPVFIGGKSMGGRVASLILESTNAAGCICMGYPFHPPGKPDKLRTAHLLTNQRPMLILQGERDTFGTKDEIPDYDLPSTIQVRYIDDGDHSFKPRKASGSTLESNIQSAITRTANFIQQHS